MFIYYPPPTWLIIHKGIRHINSTMKAPYKPPIIVINYVEGIDDMGRPPQSYYPIQGPPEINPSDLISKRRQLQARLPSHRI